MSSPKKQTIVITGANRGIGFAMVKIFKQRGCKVFALCRKSSKALTALDVNVIEGIELTTSQGIDKAKLALTDLPIDLLINNAGILRSEQLNTLDNKAIIEQFTVNALAPLSLCEALLLNLHSGSKIAFITSRMGSITDNESGGYYGYRMSKAALNIAAVSLAKDLSKKNISIGIYHPGYVRTDMVNNNGDLINGDISAEEAAQRLISLTDEQTMSNSGTFKHANGQSLGW
jgi:NAD(P)-dependent dehydrogenase (short-subunit alcohol dehydrogenase family)